MKWVQRKQFRNVQSGYLNESINILPDSGTKIRIALCITSKEKRMSISLQLDSKLERKLNNYAKKTGKPKSELIRNLVSDFLEKESRDLTPWELGKKVFGREGSGNVKPVYR
jgi:hypothetical protein